MPVIEKVPEANDQEHVHQTRSVTTSRTSRLLESFGDSRHQIPHKSYHKKYTRRIKLNGKYPPHIDLF